MSSDSLEEYWWLYYWFICFESLDSWHLISASFCFNSDFGFSFAAIVLFIGACLGLSSLPSNEWLRKSSSDWKLMTAGPGVVLSSPSFVRCWCLFRFPYFNTPLLLNYPKILFFKSGSISLTSSYVFHSPSFWWSFPSSSLILNSLSNWLLYIFTAPYFLRCSNSKFYLMIDSRIYARASFSSWDMAWPSPSGFLWSAFNFFFVVFSHKLRSFVINLFRVLICNLCSYRSWFQGACLTEAICGGILVCVCMVIGASR